MLGREPARAALTGLVLHTDRKDQVSTWLSAVRHTLSRASQETLITLRHFIKKLCVCMCVGDFSKDPPLASRPTIKAMAKSLRAGCCGVCEREREQKPCVPQ